MPRMNDENTHPVEMYSAYEADAGSIQKENFDELRNVAEAMADRLNMPLAYRFADDDGPRLTVTLLLPRKMRTFEVATDNFDRDEAQTWLNEFTRRYWNRWFGWDEDTDTDHCWVCRTTGHVEQLARDGKRWICVSCNDE